jgi:ABC-type antimicrobial peptide transport system permease subunit
MASQVASNLGVYPINLELPVLSGLLDTSTAALFLGIILNIIVFILFLLSLVLLYNLLLVSIETKTFELAVLRVQGLNKVGIISLILVQSSFYVFPAVLIGILLAIPILD